jgi:serine/threonine protein phosphatase PrpC
MRERLSKVFKRAKERNLVVDSKEIKELLRQAYYDAYSNLPTQATCASIAVLIVGQKVFCANSGQSKAILSRSLCQIEQETPQIPSLAIPLARDQPFQARNVEILEMNLQKFD